MPRASTTLSPSLSERLQTATEALAAVHTQPEVLHLVLTAALEALDAVAGAVLLVDDSGTRLDIALTQGHEEGGQTLSQDGPLNGNVPAGDALLRRQPLFFEHQGALTAAYPELERRTGGVAAIATAVLPMFLDSSPLGALILDFKEPHTFTPEEVRFLRTLSAQCAVALGRARLHQELETRVAARTAELEAQRAALDAFVVYKEAVGHESDVRALARQAVRTVQANLQHVSVAYYEREGDVWKARVWSEDISPEIVAQITMGVSMDAPNFAQAARSGTPHFVDGWDAAANDLPTTTSYGAVALLPILVRGETHSLLAVGTQEARAWTEREQALVRAVARGLNLTLERTEQTRRLAEQNAELEARTQALEGFAHLTRDLSSQGDPRAFVRRAQEVVLSLLPPGYALYYERDGERWRNRVQTGDVGHPDLQAFIDAGPLVGATPSVDIPWQTGQPLYQDTYAQGSDTPPEIVQHVNTVASLPVRRHGEVVGVFIAVLFGARPWTEADRVVLETVVGSLGLALERAQAATDLARASRFNELILNNVGEGLAGVDLQGRNTFANPAALQLLGYTAEEFLDRPQHALIHHTRPDGTPYPAGTCPIYAALRGEASAVTGEVFWRKDGTSFPVEYTSTPIRNEAGEIEGAVLAFRDVTERQRAEEQLRRSNLELQRSNAELEQFAYVASHDLQAPIRAMTSFAGIIERRYGHLLDERGQTYLQHIMDGGEHMKRLVDDLLTFSRVHTQQRPLQPTDANAVFDAVARRVTTGNEETRLVRDDLPVVLADAQQLDQLLQNLISNGLKYRREGVTSRVHVSAQPDADGACWRFAVRDNGIGMEPQYFERIFVIFQRLHGREEYEGTGIGLAVCKKIVERHGGRIWVESTPGEGTTFFFTLKAA